MADRLLADGNLPDRAREEADKLSRMLLGMVPVLAAAAGLAMPEMDRADQDSLRVYRFAGVGVQS